MARRRARNRWELLGDQTRSSYWAELLLFGDEHFVLRSYVEESQAPDGSRIGSVEQEPVLDPKIARWIEALRAFDDRDCQNKEPLIALLKSYVEMPPIVHGWLVDLLQRYQITPKGRGRPTDYERRALSRVGLEDLVTQRSSLASMIARCDFKLRGRPVTPIYDLSESEVRLGLGRMKVNQYRERDGGSIGDNVERVAGEMFPRDAIKASEFAHTLALFLDGRHAATRRKAKRRA